ncbi:MAG: hypothetical protein PHC88_03820 [Terrimicrobiaceae bacterium]|nr:hypothetical protein [Terrimicrobiaceae bacterium]
MNRKEDILERLFRAAASAAREPGSPPHGLESRVLASWRSSSGGGTFSPDALAIFRRALICSLALVCVVGAWEYNRLNDDADPTTQIADEAFLTALNR